MELTLEQKRERKRNYMRRYRATPEGKAATGRANRSPKGKERHRKYRRSAKGRATEL